MISKTLYFSILFFVTILLPSNSEAYQWPFQGDAGQITGTFAEYRGASINFPMGRLHAGQDMEPLTFLPGQTTSLGTTILAIEGGSVSTGGSGNSTSVQVGRFVYVHVTLLNTLSTGDTVNSGDPIATIKDTRPTYSPHLHLSEFVDDTLVVQLNPLRQNGGLDGYTDSISPSVYSPTFYQDPQLNQFLTVDANGNTIAWGHVDIHAQANEYASNGTVLGLYQLGFAIQASNGSFPLSAVYRTVFNQLDMQASDINTAEDYDNSNEAGTNGIIYDSTLSTVRRNSVPGSTTASYNWLTSRLNSQDGLGQAGTATSGFWNSKQQLNQSETVDAPINAQAMFPDGVYTV